MENWWAWTFWTETLRGSLHFAAALFALLVGPIIFIRRKGDIPHRWLGRVWAACMLLVTGSALIMYDMRGGVNLFHLFAVMSLATLIPGVWTIRKYKRTRERQYLVAHQHFMSWTYFGLASAGVWQIIFTFVRLGYFKVPIGMLHSGLSVLTAVVSISLFFYLSKKYPNVPTIENKVSEP